MLICNLSADMHLSSNQPVYGYDEELNGCPQLRPRTIRLPLSRENYANLQNN